MDQISHFEVIQKLKVFNENISLWLCEKVEGGYVEVLTIAQNVGYQKLLERLLVNEVKPLTNREIPGVQQLHETGFDAAHQCFFLVYEHLENHPSLAEIQDYATLQSIKEIAIGLDLLKKENRQTYLISPTSIAINWEGNAKLKFAGLFELFKHQNLLENDYLGPNVQAWLQDAKKPRPNFQDDMYSLIKSFEFVLTSNPSEAAQEILQKALNENRIDRFPKYFELLELLERILVAKKRDRDTIKVVTQAENQRKLEPVLKEMNEQAWFLLDKELSKSKNQITGQFTTLNWSGRFFVDYEGYIFIDFNGCRNQKNHGIVKNINSFLADFEFTPYYSSYKCYYYFKQKIEAQNQLSILQNRKTNALKLWQKLPEKELEFIQENAFKAKYEARKPASNNASNVKFKLVDVSRHHWAKIKELKQDGVVLFIDDQRVGKILDFHQEENLLVVKDTLCSMDEIPERGELVEDVRQETSQFKKQVEACKKFEKSDVVNPALCSILATPETTYIPGNRVRLHEDDFIKFKENVFNKDLQNDDTQREAVLEALHHKPVYLIQGPPGTGKTTVIVELIRQILKREKDAKILVTSQSNLAVDNVLERLAQVNQMEKQDLRFMRLASDYTLDKDTISKEVLPHTFENKLKNWVQETEDKAKKYLTTKFGVQEKGQSSDQFLKLKNLQRDWFAFLGGITIDDGKDRKRSMLNNGSTEMDFLTAMMQRVNVIGATCIHIASGKYNRINFRFDYVIMDESSKASAAEALVPVNMGQNIVFIGDHKQLPPVVTREDAIKKKVKTELEDNGLDFEKDFGESLFEKLIKAFEADETKVQYIKMLDVQYRMPRQVGELISKYFYEGKLKNPGVDIIPDYDNQKHHALKLKKETSIIFMSTSQRENPSDNDNKFNRQNKCNIQEIKDILTKLNELYKGNAEKKSPFTIGIIAGYRGQVELLKKNIPLSEYHNFILSEQEANGRKKNTYLIEINTVDKFQGAERDIIIYDVVRSSPGKSNIGFLDDYRRINVAFSRVKRLLILVGDSEYLIKRATLNPNGKFTTFKLQQIARDLQEKGLVFNQMNEILP